MKPSYDGKSDDELSKILREEEEKSLLKGRAPLDEDSIEEGAEFD